jgi:hypothetical protein
MNSIVYRARRYGRYLLLAGLLVLLTACSVKAGDFELSDPVREAEATRVAMAAQDESARRAVERQIIQAQADKAKADAEAARNALPAATLRNALLYTGTGVGVLVLAVGCAFAAVAWLNKRATSIYPNSAGMYPVIVKRSWNGVTIVHDPNRALGPTTIYTTPGLAGLLLKKAESKPAAQFPMVGSEGAMLQLATQAQAIGLVAAATRNNRGDESNMRQAGQLAQTLINRPAICAPLPPVRASALEASHVERLLLEGDE